MKTLIKEVSRTARAALVGWPETMRLILIIGTLTVAATCVLLALPGT